jgi:hypothetical protein
MFRFQTRPTELDPDLPQEMLDAIGLDGRTAIVVLSHDTKLDDPALDRALRMRDDACLRDVDVPGGRPYPDGKTTSKPLRVRSLISSLGSEVSMNSTPVQLAQPLRLKMASAFDSDRAFWSETFLHQPNVRGELDASTSS